MLGAHIRHEVREQLRVCLRHKGVAIRHERLAQRREVLDDAIVHNGNAAIHARVRVRVDIVGRAMRGPARVRDTKVGAQAHLLARGLKVGHLALQCVRVCDGVARRGEGAGGAWGPGQAAQGPLPSPHPHPTHRLLDDAHGAIAGHAHPSRVIAAVLEALQTRDEDLNRLAVASAGG